MERAGQLWIPDGDSFFRNVFEQTGDKFDYSSLTAALNQVQDWRFAVEIGAHVGSWTRALAERFDRVLAFEPDPTNFECLAENTRHLKNVSLMTCAIGSDTGFCRTIPGHQNSGQAHITPAEAGIPVYPLDQFCIQTLDFLKIDVEGYELPVLQGADETITRCRPVVLIEENGLCGRYGIKPGAAGHFLESLGYQLTDRVNRDYIYVT